MRLKQQWWSGLVAAVLSRREEALRRGKARRARTVPLPHDVGEAIVAYV